MRQGKSFVATAGLLAVALLSGPAFAGNNAKGNGSAGGSDRLPGTIVTNGASTGELLPSVKVPPMSFINPPSVQAGNVLLWDNGFAATPGNTAFANQCQTLTCGEDTAAVPPDLNPIALLADDIQPAAGSVLRAVRGRITFFNPALAVAPEGFRIRIWQDGGDSFPAAIPILPATPLGSVAVDAIFSIYQNQIYFQYLYKRTERPVLRVDALQRLLILLTVK